MKECKDEPGPAELAGSYYLSRSSILNVLIMMISKSKGKSSNSFVGIFWAIQEQGSATSIVDHRCSLKEAEPYGTMLTCPHGHYEVWEQWRKTGGRAAIATSEYEEWPRGRIVYDRENEGFILYADAQILRDPALLTAIHERFGLPMERTDPKRDNHYRSTRSLNRQINFAVSQNGLDGSKTATGIRSSTGKSLPGKS